MQEYIKADQYLHQLVQVIAKANRTFVPKKGDDSHTNLYYDPLGGKIYGRWIEIRENRIILALNLNAYAFEIIDEHYNNICDFPILGEKIPELEKVMKKGLHDIGLDVQEFSDPLHFKITDYPFKNEPFGYLPDNGLEQWKKIRKHVNEMCLHVQGFLQVESEIRIWPHHFDTGIYIEPNADLAIGFGLAMADQMEPSPYLYLSGNALDKEDLKFKDLPKLRTGRWVMSEQWKGAILPIVAMKSMDENEMRKVIFSFIISSVSWYLHQ